MHVLAAEYEIKMLSVSIDTQQLPYDLSVMSQYFSNLKNKFSCCFYYQQVRSLETPQRWLVIEFWPRFFVAFRFTAERSLSIWFSSLIFRSWNQRWKFQEFWKINIQLELRAGSNSWQNFLKILIEMQTSQFSWQDNRSFISVPAGYSHRFIWTESFRKCRFAQRRCIVNK